MIDTERTLALNELTKIKAEIADLLVQKAEIVRDINIPVYRAKAEAEKIIKEAYEKSEAMRNASSKIQSEAEQKSFRADELMQSAKDEMAKVNVERNKLESDKVNFDAEKVILENMMRQKRNVVEGMANDFRRENDGLQQRLVEVKQREETVTRREEITNTKENHLKALAEEYAIRQKTLDEYCDKIKTQQTEVEAKRSEVLAKEGDLLSIQDQINETKAKNQALLNEMVARKEDLTRQQNDLARQIEIYDNSKAEVDEKMRALKEQQRLVEMKIRQNQEKIDTINQLRKEEK